MTEESGSENKFGRIIRGDKKSTVSYEIFKKQHGNLIEEIKKISTLYLLKGMQYSGKTTILRNIYYDLIIHKKCEFIEGSEPFTPIEFFDKIGIKIKQNENYKTAGTIYFMNFDKVLFIDDFDKLLANLGGDFAAYLRAMIQEFNINVICTATLDSKEMDKYLLRYDTPFYRFFRSVLITYHTEDIKEIGNFYKKEIKDEDANLISEIFRDNISAIEYATKNYNEDVNIAIYNTVKNNPSIINEIAPDISPQQRQILDNVCRYIVENSKDIVTLDEIEKHLFLDETILRTQLNRMRTKGLIIYEKKKGYLPNRVFIEKKRIEISENHLYKGNTLMNKRNFEEAEKEFREAIKINPNYADAHNNLGILLQNLNRYEEAEKEYRESIRINPNYAEAHNNLGNLLQNLNRYEEAEKEYREAIRINPNYILAYQNLSELYFVIKNYQKSSEYAEKSLEISKEIKDNVISKFLVLINLIALERGCEKEKDNFLSFIRKNKGYELTWEWTIKERIKGLKFEGEIFDLTEEIEKFGVRK